jgi:hypothetical protein
VTDNEETRILRRDLTTAALELGKAQEVLLWIESTSKPKVDIVRLVRNYLKEYRRLYEDPK